MKRKIRYATARIEAIRTLATPSKHILHIDDLDPGTRVVLYARASTRQQNENLPHQISMLKAEVEKRGLIVIATFHESAQRDVDSRPQFERAIDLAKEKHAVILAESTDRLKGCFYYPPGNLLKLRTPAPLDVFTMQRLIDEVQGVGLATVNPPDAPEKIVRSYQTKRGQQGKERFGGRPKKHKPTKLIRLQKMGAAISLWKSGTSYRKIGRQLDVHPSTIRDWIKRIQRKIRTPSAGTSKRQKTL